MSGSCPKIQKVISMGLNLKNHQKAYKQIILSLWHLYRMKNLIILCFQEGVCGCYGEEIEGWIWRKYDYGNIKLRVFVSGDKYRKGTVLCVKQIYFSLNLIYNQSMQQSPEHPFKSNPPYAHHKKIKEPTTSIYNYLPQANPLQPQTKRKPSAIYQFIGESPPNFQRTAETSSSKNNKNSGNDELQQASRIQQGIESLNLGVHDMGTSLKQLFKNPVYQSYQQLDRNADNYHFGTIYYSLNQQTLIHACRQIYQNKSQASEDAFEELDNAENMLKFQSRFESGNLAFATVDQNNPKNYFLALQRDTNSKATTQWYYFSVQNKNNIGPYTFFIVNCTKSYSAYEYGMKPCVYSVLDAKKQNNQKVWKRACENISYRENSFPYVRHRRYYTLQFTYNFTEKNDRVYFAYSYPYTFSMLQDFLFTKTHEYSTIFKSKILTKTVGGNPLQLLTISAPEKQKKSQHAKIQQKQSDAEEIEKRRSEKKDLIFISARVHPGQSVSSYVCQGLIQFLLGDSEQAQNIRNKFSIRIVPMLNPDGVINGNYRTSLSGNDLNRRWKRPEKELHPEIFTVKKYLAQNQNKKSLFIDLHGHSKKRSSFMYGCLNKENPYLCKQFPFILSKNGYHFSYYNCNFHTSAAKEGTSRITVWKQFKIDYTYTMEMSFFGPSKTKCHFEIPDYLKIGRELGRVMSLYFCGKKAGTNNALLEKSLSEFYENQKALKMGENSSDGSQSGEQENIVKDNFVEKVEQQTKRSDSRQKYAIDLDSKRNSITMVKYGKKLKRQESVEQKSSPCLKSRKEVSNNHVISLQKVNIGTQYQLFGLNLKEISRQLKSQKMGITKPPHSKTSYRPYSYTKNKEVERSYSMIESQKGMNTITTRAKIMNTDQSLILPRVVQQEQKFYQRYRNSETNYQHSIFDSPPKLDLQQTSQHKIPYNLGLNSRYSNNEISLGEKIHKSYRPDRTQRFKDKK